MAHPSHKSLIMFTQCLRRIIDHDGKSGSGQRKILEKLQTQEIASIRYIDTYCLYTLGIYHSVFHMLDTLGLHDIFARREPTYERLTKEFLCILIYTVSPNTASTIAMVKFRIFNVEDEYTTDVLAELLDMPHGKGFICETPLDSDWSIEAFAFWTRLSSSTISSFEDILASMIHNLVIRVFRYLLAYTIFVWENPNKVDAKELLFLQGSLTGLKINVVPFMMHTCLPL
ncbi:unnamed protein product [Vicia faba]|uniref:Arabidopsis retrotransposon Orf1 C-terminal domain-containing protein n=1 Tax=Vicia faba TaxID=3906 RepID=A0AAV1API1_VICFA|nr:unnamed protein product [Vicia faba]